MHGVKILDAKQRREVIDPPMSLASGSWGPRDPNRRSTEFCIDLYKQEGFNINAIFRV